MYHVCQSVHARGGIHTTTTLSLGVSSIQNLAYRIRKRYVVSCGKYAANLLPYRRWRVASNLAQGVAAARVPWQSPGKPPCTLPTEAQGGHSRVPNVHLQAGLVPNQVARCPMG